MSSTTVAQFVGSLRRCCACIFLCFSCLRYVVHLVSFSSIMGLAREPPRARPGPGLGVGGSRNAIASGVVDIFLALPHAVHIRLEADLFVAGLEGVVVHELHNLGPVRGESSWTSCVCIFVL